MVRSRNWKWLPAISAEEFAEHIEEESFPVQYGNPVRIYTDDGHEYICLTIELYERMSASGYEFAYQETGFKESHAHS